jgi:ABC-2 type transport system permease protein
MSAATATASPSIGRDHRPGFAQLTRVELRKTYDTRAGFWLLISCVLLMLATGLITVLSGDDESHTWSNLLNNCSQALNFILPVVGILLVTSEWSQRTALQTFTLVPQRGRVLATKIAASLVLSVLAIVAALVLTAVCTAINPAATDAFHLDAGLVLQTVLFTILSMLTGVGLGAAILISAPAIVALYVLPIAYSAVVNIIGALHGLRDWTDQSDTFSNLTDHTLSGHEWGQVATTALLWVVLPVAIGAYRFLRGEIR